MPTTSPLVRSDSPIDIISGVTRVKYSKKVMNNKAKSKPVSRRVSPPRDPDALLTATGETGHLTVLSSARQSEVLTTNLHVLSARNKRLYGLSAKSSQAVSP